MTPPPWMKKTDPVKTTDTLGTRGQEDKPQGQGAFGTRPKEEGPQGPEDKFALAAHGPAAEDPRGAPMLPEKKERIPPNYGDGREGHPLLLPPELAKKFGDDSLLSQDWWLSPYTAMPHDFPKGSGYGYVQSPYTSWWTRIYGVSPIADLPRYRFMYRNVPEIKAAIDKTVFLAVARGMDFKLPKEVAIDPLTGKPLVPGKASGINPVTGEPMGPPQIPGAEQPATGAKPNPFAKPGDQEAPPEGEDGKPLPPKDGEPVPGQGEVQPGLGEPGPAPGEVEPKGKNDNKQPFARKFAAAFPDPTKSPKDEPQAPMNPMGDQAPAEGEDAPQGPAKGQGESYGKDPKEWEQVDPKTGEKMNPATGNPLPKTSINPVTGKPMMDPNTGKPVKTKPSNQEVIDYLTTFFEGLNWMDIQIQALTDMLVYGNGWIELAYDGQKENKRSLSPNEKKDIEQYSKPAPEGYKPGPTDEVIEVKGEGRVWDMKVLDPLFMRVRRDSLGNIYGAIQWLAWPPVLFSNDKIVHVAYNRKSWAYENAYGTSQLMSLIKVQDMIWQLESDMMAVSHINIAPALTIYGGTEERPYTTPQMAALMDDMQTREAASSIFLKGDCKAEALPLVAQLGSITSFFNYLKEQRIILLGVPPDIMGIEMPGSYSKSAVSIAEFKARVKALQEAWGNALHDYIFPRILKPEFGDDCPIPRCVFRSVFEEDRAQVSARVREDFKMGLITKRVALQEAGYDIEPSDPELDEFYKPPAPPLGLGPGQFEDKDGNPAVPAGSDPDGKPVDAQGQPLKQKPPPFGGPGGAPPFGKGGGANNPNINKGASPTDPAVTPANQEDAGKPIKPFRAAAGMDALVYRAKLGEQGPFNLYLVDADYVRHNIDGRWNKEDAGHLIGGHHWALGMTYIPPDEIWISNDVDHRDRKYIMLHELTEAPLMRSGESYSAAHKVAEEVEAKARELDKSVRDFNYGMGSGVDGDVLDATASEHGHDRSFVGYDPDQARDETGKWTTGGGGGGLNEAGINKNIIWEQGREGLKWARPIVKPTMGPGDLEDVGTAFEHNKTQLRALHPTWTDEMLHEEAKARTFGDQRTPEPGPGKTLIHPPGQPGDMPAPKEPAPKAPEPKVEPPKPPEPKVEPPNPPEPKQEPAKEPPKGDVQYPDRNKYSGYLDEEPKRAELEAKRDTELKELAVSRKAEFETFKEARKEQMSRWGTGSEKRTFRSWLENPEDLKSTPIEKMAMAGDHYTKASIKVGDVDVPFHVSTEDDVIGKDSGKPYGYDGSFKDMVASHLQTKSPEELAMVKNIVISSKFDTPVHDATDDEFGIAGFSNPNTGNLVLFAGTASPINTVDHELAHAKYDDLSRIETELDASHRPEFDKRYAEIEKEVEGFRASPDAQEYTKRKDAWIEQNTHPKYKEALEKRAQWEQENKTRRDELSKDAMDIRTKRRAGVLQGAELQSVIDYHNAKWREYKTFEKSGSAVKANATRWRNKTYELTKELPGDIKALDPEEKVQAVMEKYHEWRADKQRENPVRKALQEFQNAATAEGGITSYARSYQGSFGKSSSYPTEQMAEIASMKLASTGKHPIRGKYDLKEKFGAGGLAGAKLAKARLESKARSVRAYDELTRLHHELGKKHPVKRDALDGGG